MSISAEVHVIIILLFISNALCQFPMQFPFPQQMGAPQPMGQPMMGPMRSMPPLPSPMFPQQMPMGFPMQQKMPSVVMPYYSKNADRPMRRHRKKMRKMRRRRVSWETDRDSSESSSGELDYRRAKSKKRRQVLTPVVSYVTKDGYVVYQKKIKNDKAKDWLEMTKKLKDSKEEQFTSEEERKFEKMLKYKKRRSHH